MRSIIAIEVPISRESSKTREAGLVVLGLSDRWRSEGIGSARLAVARGSDAPILFVRRGLRPGGIAPPGTLTRFTWTLESQQAEPRPKVP